MSSSSRILVSVEKHRSWVIDILSKMVSIPTVNPPGRNFKEFVDYAENLLKELGMNVRVYEVPKDVVAKNYPDYADYPRYILIARVGEGEPIIHFNGHYDVVPPGSGWDRDPFKPYLEGSKLYGRGSVDMKGGIAASILATKVFTEVFEQFKGTIEIALVPDEEIGGMTGTGYLVEKELAKPTYVIVCEPSGTDNVWIGHKGAIWAHVEVHGKQAHGSSPWLGVNAFEYMVKVAERFMSEYKKLLEGRTSRYVYEDPRGAKPTVTLGGEVKGGAKVNIVPGYYSFSIDRRLIVEEDINEVEKELRGFLSKLQKEFPEVRLDLKISGKLPPSVTSPDSKLVRTTAEAAKEVTGREPKVNVCVGGLDSHFYSSKGIDVITYGPGPVSNAHMANEFVDVDEVINAAKVYALVLGNLLAK